jgi:serine/threonine-protein kinase
MLLEAGYIEEALARIGEAVAINPARRGLQWERARAYALEGRWDEHDRLAKEMTDLHVVRPFAAARMATWKRDPDLEHAVLSELRDLAQSFAPGLIEVLIDVYSGKPWPAARERLLTIAHMRWSNRRRRTWVAQVSAEAAGWVGDVDTAAAVVELGTTDGLFDLHWLERCPLLDGLRAHPRYPQLRAPIKRRAEGVLDAMYGDQEIGTSETAVATS